MGLAVVSPDVIAEPRLRHYHGQLDYLRILCGVI
jgi:hypothetical protein